jgi:adenosylcobinamide-phosphate synthase
MALITVLLSLLIEHYLGTLEEFRRYRWFTEFTNRIRAALPERLADSPLAVALVLGLPTLVVLVLAAALAETWMVLGFGFGLLVLLYSFGPQDLEARVEAWLEARDRDDEESARWHVAEILGADMPEDNQQVTRAVMETALVEMHERLLAVVFWFVAFGPAGALLYRLAALLRNRTRNDDSAFAEWTARTHYALGWIPVRLTALGYAAAGSFVDALQYWREEAGKWRDVNRGVLIAAGLGALQYGAVESTGKEAELDDMRATIALLRRTLVVWVAALAVITLAGWTN